MANSLIVLSDTKSVTGEHLVVVDYGKGSPLLCRSGIWVGLETDFIESVVLSYEHGSDDLYVGWALNGAIVSNPGFPPEIFPLPGLPVPGAANVLYMTPVDGFLHRTSLTGQAGMAETCIAAQVLYTTFKDYQQGKPVTYGPSITVCLSGKEIIWPAAKLEQEGECLRRWREILHRVAGPVRVKPGDPVEQWLARVQGEDAVRLQGLAQVLDEADAKRDPRIVEAARQELQGIFERVRMQGQIAELAKTRRPS
jgi:hypothetical protein